MTLLLDCNDIKSLLTMSETIEAIEAAFRNFALGKVIMPQRTAIHLNDYDAVHLGMPAYIAEDGGVLALKVVTIYPHNPIKHNLPTTIGVLLLNDPATGAPLAIMEAGYLTAMRTGAVGGVAAKYLARKDAKTVGVFGAGVQAKTQLWAVCTVLPIKQARIYDQDKEKAKLFAEEMENKLSVNVEPVIDPKLAVENMDIIITATSSSTPVFDGKLLEPGQHINGIGSHSPDKRELDTVTIKKSKVVTDFLPACLAEAGDFIIPLKEGAISQEHFWADLGDIIAGKKLGRENATEITLFKSVGLAIQDVSTAALVYRKARECNAGVEFKF